MMKVPLRLNDWKAVKKTGRGYTRRELTVVRLLSQLLRETSIKTFLNIGFHDYQLIRKRWWIDLCRANDIDWYILEIHQPNCDRFKKVAPSDDHHRIIHGDLKNIRKCIEKKMDIIFHWHGPEHLLKEEYLSVLPSVESMANKLVILGSPNGLEEQGMAYGNPYEEHISFWSEDEYQRLGYKTITVDDKKPGHITAYKFITSI